MLTAIPDIPTPGSDEAVGRGCTKEVWRPVLGYEGRYEVSSIGTVRSLNWEGCTNRVKELSMSIAKGPRNAVGYHVVRLHNNGARACFVGRLVLTAFVRPPLNGEEMNHINGDTLDDGVGNLEWLTSSENKKHAIANGLALPPPSTAGKGQRYWWRDGDDEWLYKTPSEMSRKVDASAAPFFKMAQGGQQPYRSFHGWRISPVPPNPGSRAAREHSCCCPQLDNAHGKGFPWGDIKQAFWVSADCPLHGGRTDDAA